MTGPRIDRAPASPYPDKAFAENGMNDLRRLNAAPSVVGFIHLSMSVMFENGRSYSLFAGLYPARPSMIRWTGMDSFDIACSHGLVNQRKNSHPCLPKCM